MSIGVRLQKARALAGLTQEQAAEQLQVSRQTVSNWENGKTLPDMAYGKEISRVYGISLDSLVADMDQAAVLTEIPVPMKQDNVIGKTLIKNFVGCWFFAVLVFWCLRGLSGMAMLHGLLMVGVFFPAICGIIAFLVGLFDCWPSKGFVVVFLCGLGQMLLPYATFSMANIITSGNINPLSFPAFATGAVIGAVCLVLGNFVNWLSEVLTNRLERIQQKKGVCKGSIRYGNARFAEPGIHL